jgi:hypothetical protein
VIRAASWIAALALVVIASIALGHTIATQRYQAAQWRAETHAWALQDSLRVAQQQTRVDSIAVERVVTRWRTVRDVLVDTIHTTDTIRLVLEAADAAITTCTDAFGRCRTALALAARSAAADSVARVGLRAQLSLAERRALAAESRVWRHRLEGVVSALAISAGAFLLTRDE